MFEKLKPGEQTSSGQERKARYPDWFDPEKECQVQKSEKEGLLDIRQINKDAGREFLFTFDRESSVWQYIVPHHHEENIDEDEVFYHASISVNRPATDNTVTYHNHPEDHIEHYMANPKHEWQKDRKYMIVRNQFPTTRDLESEVRTALFGFKGSGIVTDLGVTMIRFNKKNLNPEDRVVSIKGMKIKEERISKMAREKGVVKTIKTLIRFYNHFYKGQFEFTFTPFEEEK